MCDGNSLKNVKRFLNAPLGIEWEKRYGGEKNIWTQSGTRYSQNCSKSGTRYS
jgi:hypothetical protein